MATQRKKKKKVDVVVGNRKWYFKDFKDRMLLSESLFLLPSRKSEYLAPSALDLTIDLYTEKGRRFGIAILNIGLVSRKGSGQFGFMGHATIIRQRGDIVGHCLAVIGLVSLKTGEGILREPGLFLPTMPPELEF